MNNKLSEKGKSEANTKQNYVNSVYDIHETDELKLANIPHYIESSDLNGINERLDNYTSTVKDLTENLKTTNKSNSTPMQTSNNYNFLVSMKNLEKDLEILKQFYDEELKFMRVQVEELSLSKNKLSLDNYNLEEKLKDFITK
jgi:hypothetical protein